MKDAPPLPLSAGSPSGESCWGTYVTYVTVGEEEEVWGWGLSPEGSPLCDTGQLKSWW